MIVNIVGHTIIINLIPIIDIEKINGKYYNSLKYDIEYEYDYGCGIFFNNRFYASYIIYIKIITNHQFL